jgi:hypothetical protein
MKEFIVTKLTSRKFWLTVASLITFVALGQYTQAAVVVLGYLGIQGLADSKK